MTDLLRISHLTLIILLCGRDKIKGFPGILLKFVICMLLITSSWTISIMFFTFKRGLEAEAYFRRRRALLCFLLQQVINTFPMIYYKGFRNQN